MIRILKSKLQEVIVTESREDYEGSLTLDEDLMDAAGFMEYEQVYVHNPNGNRDMTYILKGERGSGKVCINGALSKRHKVMDRVHVLAFTDVSCSIGWEWKPNIVKTDEENKVI